MSTIHEIRVVEDRTSEARCDKGFLRLRRLVCRNVRADGSVSRDYPVDVIDRENLDAVAVVIWRRSAETGRVEVLLRDCLRPAAYLRKEREPALADPRVYLTVPEIVAGVLEADDVGEAGVLRRSAEEVREEAGFEVDVEEIVPLGAPFFVAPGILSEKIFLTAVDVGRRPQGPPHGDGSPLEENGRTTWVDLDAAIGRCTSGEVEDAKTEIGLRRLKDRIPGGGAALFAAG